VGEATILPINRYFIIVTEASNFSIMASVFNFSINMKRVFYILPILFLNACNTNSNKHETKLPFKLPYVYPVNPNDTLKPFKESYISETKVWLAGKSKPVDTLEIRFNPDHDTAYANDYLRLVRLEESDTLKTDGFEVYPDYKTDVIEDAYNYGNANNYYPVYIVNRTSDSKLFIGKDSYVYGFQEALDEKGIWQRIEVRPSDFCGNGIWELTIHPNEFLTVLFAKYEGDFNTKLRVRIENGDNTFFSKPFDGQISKQQFIINKEKDNYPEQLFKDK